MPQANYHDARQNSPGQYAHIITKKDQGGAGIDFLIGFKNGGGSEIQSIHFDKSKFTAAQARSWLKKHKFKTGVEPARSEATVPDDLSFDEIRSLVQDELQEQFPYNNGVGYSSSIYYIDHLWASQVLVRKYFGADDDYSTLPGIALISYTVMTDDDGEKEVELGEPVECSIQAVPKDGSAAVTMEEGEYGSDVPYAEAGKRNSATDSLHANSIVRHALSMMGHSDLEPATVAHMHHVMTPPPLGSEARNLNGREVLTEAKWTVAFMNSLPDSAFAYIKAGGTKDAENKTVPRSLRYLPFKGSDGKIDLPHLRNALARLPQTNLSAEEKAAAERKLKAAAKQVGVDTAGNEAKQVDERSFTVEAWNKLDGETLTEVFTTSFTEASFDKENLIVHNVAILGSSSKNNREYPMEIQQKAAPLFEGAKSYLNHPTSDRMNEPRQVQDLLGEYRNIQVKNGTTYGDWHLINNPLVQETVVPIIESKPHLAGNSIVVRAKQKVTKEGKAIVEEIFAVRSVDLVAEPATTKGIFESQHMEADMDWKDVTAEGIKERRPDLIKALLEPGPMEALENENKKLKDEIAARDKKIADFDLKEAQREKEEAQRKHTELVTRLLSESKIPEKVKYEEKDGKKVFKPHFLNLVTRCESAEEMQALIGDWEKAYAQTRPISENKEFHFGVQPVTDDKVSALYDALVH